MKEFKVGDKVWNPVYGNGVVKTLRPQSAYPVRIFFAKWVTVTSFTEEGKHLASNVAPTLFHGHDLILEAREPKRVWVNVYWDKDTAEGWTGAPHSSEALAIQLIQDSDGSIYLKTIELTIPE
jgi:hypothetical protein